MKAWLVVLGTLALALATVAAPAAAADHAGSGPPGGAVFVQTNAIDGNQIVAYERSASGALTWVSNTSTGGNGTGTSLADQGSLALTQDHRWLLAVDAGSNQLSVLGLQFEDGIPSLVLADVVSSDGVAPVSVTVSQDLVYVLNDGNLTVAGNLAGFWLSPDGVLTLIPGSVAPLSGTTPTGAAQVSFGPDGDALVVTEKATNLLDVYQVGPRGVAVGPTLRASQGTTPYGFAFTPQGSLVVSEAATGSLSSYRLGGPGGWRVVSAVVPDYQGAPCWVVIGANGRTAFTSNAHSDSISSYAVGGGGKLTLQNDVAATTDSTPTDLALTSDGAILYVYDAGAHEVQGYLLGPSGLGEVATIGGLPGGAEGLLAL